MSAVGTIMWSYRAGNLRMRLNEIQMQIAQVQNDLRSLAAYGSSIVDGKCDPNEMMAADSCEAFARMDLFNAKTNNLRYIMGENQPINSEELPPWLKDYIKANTASIAATSHLAFQKLETLTMQEKMVAKHLSDAEKRSEGNENRMG